MSEDKLKDIIECKIDQWVQASISTKIKDTIYLITMMKEVGSVKGSDTVDMLLERLKKLV